MLSSATNLKHTPNVNICRNMRTFQQLAAVDLAGCDLDGDNVALRPSAFPPLVWGLRERTAASLRSLIGIPIVLVMVTRFRGEVCYVRGFGGNARAGAASEGACVEGGRGDVAQCIGARRIFLRKKKCPVGMRLCVRVYSCRAAWSCCGPKSGAWTLLAHLTLA